jgi:shikimate kinase
MTDTTHPHVVLVGLSASGKTSIGRLVAERLSMRFLDTDDAIEAQTGRSVREVFAGDGEARFREIEAGAVAEALAAEEPTVLATGGGAVVTAATRERLRADDVFVVWLTAEPAFLASRLSDKPHRPLLDADPASTLARLAAERQPFFEEVADAVVDVQPALRDEPKLQAKTRLAGHVTELVKLRRSSRSRNHLVLVGPMGSGKSTVGKVVADRLGRRFVDSDDEIERRTGRTAREIAAADGLPVLHRLELDVLRDALAADEPSVIGSAASVVDEPLGRLALSTADQVVWLRADPRELEQRSATGSHRPTVPPEVMAAREPRYRSVATSAVDVDDLAPEVVADKVLALC